MGFVTLSRKAVREYAPVKNSPESAIDKVKQGLDAHCASSGEADFYALHGDFSCVLGGMSSLVAEIHPYYTGVYLSKCRRGLFCLHRSL